MTRRIAVNEDVAPADDEEAGRKPSRPADDGVGLEGDWANIFVLLLLYTLQGIPMGLASSVPLILQEKGATYMQQAGFDIVSYPFSLKLLWAPLVDSLFVQRFGRRKTWLVPVQIAQTGYMIAFTGFLALNQLGYVTLGGFMQIWGVVFLAVTVLVALLKKEGVDAAAAAEPGVMEVYGQIVKVFRLHRVRQFVLVLITWKIAFAADAVSGYIRAFCCP
eukprot:g383.t1